MNQTKTWPGNRGGAPGHSPCVSPLFLAGKTLISCRSSLQPSQRSWSTLYVLYIYYTYIYIYIYIYICIHIYIHIYIYICIHVCILYMHMHINYLFSSIRCPSSLLEWLFPKWSRGNGMGQKKALVPKATKIGGTFSTKKYSSVYYMYIYI